MLNKLLGVRRRAGAPKHGRMSSTSLSDAGTTAPQDQALTRGYRALLAGVQSGRVQELDFRPFNSFASTIVDDLAQVFEGGNSNVSTVNLSGMGLGQKIINEILRILGFSTSASHITKIDISGNDFHINGSSELVEVLPQMTNLQELTLNNNSFVTLSEGQKDAATQTADDFFSALSKSASLHTLNLDKMEGLDSKAVDTVASYIASNPKLQVFTIGNNKLKDADTAKLLKSLSTLKNLKTLNLSGCAIGLKSLPELKKVLENNTVEVLDLSNTCEFGEIAEVFARQTKNASTTSIKTLNLAGNGLADESVEDILKYISPHVFKTTGEWGSPIQHTKQVKLDLSRNALTDGCTSSLLSRLCSHEQLPIVIKLGNNNLTYESFIGRSTHSIRQANAAAVSLDLGGGFQQWQVEGLKKRGAALGLTFEASSEGAIAETRGVFAAVKGFFSGHKKVVVDTQAADKQTARE